MKVDLCVCVCLVFPPRISLRPVAVSPPLSLNDRAGCRRSPYSETATIAVLLPLIINYQDQTGPPAADCCTNKPWSFDQP